MGLLARTATLACVVTATACYAPDVRDCAVKCSGETGCADGQQCGRDGYCVDNESVRCTSEGAVIHDAGTAIVLDDAKPADAAVDAPPDAPTHGTLVLAVSGKGTVDVSGEATCSSTVCDYSIKLDNEVTLSAKPGKDFRFERWDGALCPDDESSTCTFTMPLAASVGARFKKH